ncbi:14908_t:CDS:2 [Entrophospora sp. SA101]|nr:14908_t:CDS:2 [Entrophospora sp. SA101]
MGGKIISLTTDNTTNMVSIGEKLSNELELRFGKHYRCVSHIINLAELYHILEPVYEATKLLSSSSSYPTIGDVRLAFICMFITPDHYLNALQQSMNFSKTWRIFLD